METEVIPRKKQFQRKKYHVDMSSDEQVANLMEKYSDKDKYDLACKIDEKDMFEILKRYSHDLKVDLYTVAECFNISDHTLWTVLKNEKYKSYFESCKKARGERVVQEGYITACTPFERSMNGEDITMAEVASAKLKANYCLEYGRALNSDFCSKKAEGSSGGINVVVQTGVELNI